MRRHCQRVPPKSSRSSGFSLVEVFIALFVFAIGMLAVTAMCLISIQGNSMVNRVTQANFLAQSRMEELLSEPSMTALDLQDNVLEPEIDGTGNAGGTYMRIVDIATVAGQPDTRWITVNVGWTDSRGIHEVELKSLSRAR